MTPRRFAALTVALVIPGLTWAMVENGRNDLVLKTRSLMGQAKKDRPGLFDGFFARYRFPEEEARQQRETFVRLWRVMREVEPIAGSGLEGEPREGRRVRIRGRTASDGSVQFEVAWVRHAGDWYIRGFSGWEPPPQRRLPSAEREANERAQPPTPSVRRP